MVGTSRSIKLSMSERFMLVKVEVGFVLVAEEVEEPGGWYCERSRDPEGFQ